MERMDDMTQEPTIRDVMGKLGEMQGDISELKENIGVLTESMQEFATSVDERFNKVDGRLDSIEGEVSHVKNQMVTKGYLEDKLADHHSDLIIWVRREDQKVLETVKGWMGKK